VRRPRLLQKDCCEDCAPDYKHATDGKWAGCGHFKCGRDALLGYEEEEGLPLPGNAAACPECVDLAAASAAAVAAVAAASDASAAAGV